MEPVKFYLLEIVGGGKLTSPLSSFQQKFGGPAGSGIACGVLVNDTGGYKEEGGD